MKKSNEVILIVDDEPLNVEIVELALDDDYNLVVARDGNEALEKLNDIVPAVILLDIMMPGIDGHEVCKKVRADERFQLTKIVLLSGKAMIDERLEGHNAGANDYITKPFEEEELQARVRTFFDLYIAEKKLLDLKKIFGEIS